MLDYDSPSALKAFLDSRGMSMQKKFGQNFLINANARAKLADALNINRSGDFLNGFSFFSDRG